MQLQQARGFTQGHKRCLPFPYKGTMAHASYLAHDALLFPSFCPHLSPSNLFTLHNFTHAPCKFSAATSDGISGRLETGHENQPRKKKTVGTSTKSYFCPV
jgi:hypothetical protein